MSNDNWSGKTALVTGANRGLGLETVRQLAKKGIRVILASRDEAKGRAAVATLEREGAKGVLFFHLDVTEPESIARARAFVEGEFGRLDILVNNAGILIDGDDSGDDTSAFKVSVETIRKTLETNTFGAYQLCQALLPMMKKQRFGRVVNVSSGMGQLSEMNGGYPAYRISKTALNVVTRVFADELEGSGVLVNSICPGWVKTDMGGAGAELSVAEGADTIVWAATLPEGGPTGGFFRERAPIAF